MAKIDQKLKDDIAQNYAERSAKYFVGKYNVSFQTVYDLSASLGVTSNQRWSKDKEAIIEEYAAGGLIKEIAKKYGHYSGNVKKHLIKWGVHVRTLSEAKRLYEFDRNFFKQIDTEEKAYWLGFIYADGNVYKNEKNKKNVFQICLAKKDGSHLKKLKSALKSDQPLYNDGGNSRFMINDVELVKDLIKLGSHPRKSLTLKFPTADQVPCKWMSHFIRGYFDGDGSISLGKDGRRWNFSIISTESFLTPIQNIFTANGLSLTKLYFEKRSGHGLICNISFRGYIPKNKVRNIETCNLIKLYRYLYKDASLWMPRKKLKFEKILTLLYKNDWI